MQSFKSPPASRQASTAWQTFRDRDEWIELVLADDLTTAAKVIATRIALHHNIETGQCDPSIIGLVKRTRTSDSTVRRAIKELEGAGWLAVDRTSGRYRNAYQLLTPTLPHAEGFNPVGSERVQPCNPTAGGGQPCQNAVPNPVTGERQTANLKQRNKQRRESDSPELDLDEDRRRDQREDSDFEEFYRNYPKHVAKAAAQKAYKAARKKATAAELLQGALRYSAERQGQDPKYTKHPSTWLNSGCWADEAARPIGTTTIDATGNPVHMQHRPPPGNAHAARAQHFIDKLKAQANGDAQ